MAPSMRSRPPSRSLVRNSSIAGKPTPKAYERLQPSTSLKLGASESDRARWLLIFVKPHPPGLAASAHRNARRRPPKGVKFRYCPASRISGPPPPRQAAGDPSAVSTKFFNPRQRFFLHTSFSEEGSCGHVGKRILSASCRLLSSTPIFNFDVVD